MQFQIELYLMHLCMYMDTDYGRTMKPFFIEIQNFWACLDKFWGIWDIFG